MMTTQWIDLVMDKIFDPHWQLDLASDGVGGIVLLVLAFKASLVLSFDREMDDKL